MNLRLSREHLRLPSAHTVLLVSLLVLGAMWTVPFLLPYKAPPVPSFRAEALAAALGLVALVAVLPWVGRLPLPRIALLPLGFVPLLLVQMAVGQIAIYQQALLACLHLLWAAALMVLGALLRRELGLERVAAPLAWFLFAGLVASSIVGLAQHLESYTFLAKYITVGSRRGVWGNLAQPNHLANYMSLGLASLLFLFATGRLRMGYALAVGALSIYIVSLTGSRSPWLYCAALTALAGTFFARERSQSNRRLLVASVLVLAALYLVPVAMRALLPTSGPAPVTSTQRLMRHAAASEERPRLFRAAWLMFADAPVLGVGFRQFAVKYFYLNAVIPSRRGSPFTDHAHNLPLHVMAEFGAVGLIVLLLGTVPWLLGLFRQPRSPAFWWTLAITAVMAIHCMLEYPLWYTYFLGVAAVALGLSEARTLELRAANGRLRRLRVALVSMLLLGSLVLGQLVRDYLVLENFLAFRYRYLHASEEVNRQATETLLELRRNSLLAPWVELGLARTIHVSADRLADKLMVNTTAMRVFPIDDVVYRQAMLLALAGEQGAARAHWDLAVGSYREHRQAALLVLRRRVEDGVSELRPLLAHAENVK